MKKRTENKIGKIRLQYIITQNKLNVLYQKQNQLSIELRSILDSETEFESKKQIIDFIFKDKVEEVHEHAFRKMYLEGN